ncbi:catechol 2,3-dioxygenase-like lactoylglutathione lyase family enzyme [Prosthecobacter fusiformis]|uniref:Catechol 2,3-dioxygenase-like lactoylglutathione lyase family enzyme n=1 Tax=Prosthecobacter fusiformis TaxID=48464 RepID=A0A4R7SRP8_9BACT|nr:VOC family protein [Prosthecobacter fusiformis]TDU80838.1 catechol 2,3-dioxygenase-like lactoylglutathione lyase family enzyme [Prosthecobacter fusiformis]
MLKVTEFAFTGYSVTDMKRAREFYENVLNLKVASTFGEDLEKPEWVEYEVGPHVLALCIGGDMWKPSKDGGGVALEVEDFEASLQWLKNKGVEPYFGPYESPVCHMALVNDPDGNSICIHKRKPGHH